VNFIRSEVKAGKTPRDISKDDLKDDKYLQPVLEDDALLFSLDDIVEDGYPTSEDGGVALNKDADASPSAKIAELEDQLQRLQSQFTDFKLATAKTLDERWAEKDTLPTRAPAGEKLKGAETEPKDEDSGYFESYSYNCN
jgi:type I protein arginine methyltransferase